MIFEVPMVATIRTMSSWNVMPRNLLYRNLPTELLDITSQKTVTLMRSDIVAQFLNASISNFIFFG